MFGYLKFEFVWVLVNLNSFYFLGSKVLTLKRKNILLLKIQGWLFGDMNVVYVKLMLSLVTVRKSRRLYYLWPLQVRVPNSMRSYLTSK